MLNLKRAIIAPNIEIESDRAMSYMVGSRALARLNREIRDERAAEERRKAAKRAEQEARLREETRVARRIYETD